MNHATEIIALCAALDTEAREYLLAIGRRMLEKQSARIAASRIGPTRAPPKLQLLSFGGDANQKLVSDRVVGLPSGSITLLPRKPVSR
jgi:hypothetical protein